MKPINWLFCYLTYNFEACYTVCVNIIFYYNIFFLFNRFYVKVKRKEEEMNPLKSLRILDLTDGNPYTGSIFADYGAEVLKIEKPIYGDSIRKRGESEGKGNGLYQSFYNRNKRSMSLDIETEMGQDVLKKLVTKFDMLITNKSEFYMRKLNLSYDELKQMNKQLIYGILTPYGETGPWKDMPDYDLLINSRTGLQEKTGMPDKPVKFGFPLAYIYSSWHLSAGMMAAYLKIPDTNEGAKVSVSIWHTVVSLDDTFAELLYGLNSLPYRIGNGFPTTNPTDTFKCKNGWFALSIGSDLQWCSFARAAKRNDWATDPKYAHDPARSMEHYFGDLDQQLKEFFAAVTIEEADRICREAMVPGGPCNTVQELVNDEQVRTREMIIHVKDPIYGDTLQIGKAAKFSKSDDTDCEIKPAPLLGEHTDMYLKQLDLEDSKIEQLKVNSVV